MRPAQETHPNQPVIRPPAPQPKTQMAIGCLIIPLIVAAMLVGVYSYIRANATPRLTVPKREMVLVRAMPAESASLLARFGQGHTLRIVGRTEDWGWLEVEFWGGQRGWTQRPLDILVWQLKAPEKSPQTPGRLPPLATPVPQEMIAIPPSTFTMGSPPGLGEADEEPAHPVSISAFEIDRIEVTAGQYWQCVAAGECAAPIAAGSQIEPHYLNDPSFDNYPVSSIPWAEANRYCIWQGKRLPTEAEWELAAGWDNQRGAKLLWPWGNDPAQGRANVGDTSRGKPAPVGSFSGDESPLGVMDLAGNVSEWVFDWYKVDYYRVADDTDPIGPTPRRGEGTGRVVRGASFADTVEQARTANRDKQEVSYGYPTLGFRCARDR